MRRTPVMATGGLLFCLSAIVSSVSACSSPANEPAPGTSSTPSTIAEPVGPNDVDTELPEPEAAPTWDQAARAASVQAATEAMTVFTSHDADADAWWQRLSPRLSAQAAGDYAGTDPDAVPARSVGETAVLVDDASPYLATVQVPTDAGDYQVLLSRAGDAQPWLVERMTPPPREYPG